MRLAGPSEFPPLCIRARTHGCGSITSPETPRLVRCPVAVVRKVFAWLAAIRHSCSAGSPALERDSPADQASDSVPAHGSTSRTPRAPFSASHCPRSARHPAPRPAHAHPPWRGAGGRRAGERQRRQLLRARRHVLPRRHFPVGGFRGRRRPGMLGTRRPVRSVHRAGPNPAGLRTGSGLPAHHRGRRCLRRRQQPGRRVGPRGLDRGAARPRLCSGWVRLAWTRISQRRSPAHRSSSSAAPQCTGEAARMVSSGWRRRRGRATARGPS